MMKQIKFLMATVAIMFSLNLAAQEKPVAAKVFHGAIADQKKYKAVYQLNSDEDKKILATIKNINNALEDPRLKGKLEIELVVHGGGVISFKKDSPYQEQFLQLKNKGVILAECENTLKERNISKDELLPFISYVPSGNGELIIRQAQGWAIIHP
ncbi:DsrE family protein [Pedobacter nototheniae]|uniref:DsrE family protein n=1 Tax=Pedobacter nototheniae TaxID=2488994 RepID=UPI002931121C|nr:DsrE family protein [Pedobacter nototheniae]